MIVDATGSQKNSLLRFIRSGMHTALDVGCGAGEKTALIAGHIQTTVGIEPDAGLMRRAQARHALRGPRFGVGRAEALCFATASFDAVFFNESLHHVPAEYQIDALCESHRVLRPRGRVLISEPIHGSGALGQTLQLYLDEKEQEQHAAEAIEAVMKGEFALAAKSVIRVEYRFAGFGTFFEFWGANRPEEGTDESFKKALQSRFGRCRRTREGYTIVDYDATVWQLVKT